MINKNLSLMVILTALSFSFSCSPVNTKNNKEPRFDTTLLELQNRANEAYQNDDLVTSERDYQRLIKKIPEIPLNWFRLGNIHARTNRPDTAMDFYREAILRDPKFTRAWYNLSIMQLRQTAFSLHKMLTYTNKNNPLYPKAKIMLDEIKAIISGD